MAKVLGRRNDFSHRGASFGCVTGEHVREGVRTERRKTCILKRDVDNFAHRLGAFPRTAFKALDDEAGIGLRRNSRCRKQRVVRAVERFVAEVG